MLEIKKTQMSLSSCSPHFTSPLKKKHPHTKLGDSTKSVFISWAPGHIWKLFPLPFLQHRTLFSFFFNLFQSLQGDWEIIHYKIHHGHGVSNQKGEKGNILYHLECHRCWSVNEPFEDTSALLLEKPEKRQISEAILQPSCPASNKGDGDCVITSYRYPFLGRLSKYWTDLFLCFGQYTRLLA